MHPHTAQTPRGAGLQRGRPPVPQFPADAALAPADELLFEEIADVVVIDRVPRKSFRSRAHSTYVERRLRGRQKSRRSIAAAARSSCDCTSSPQSVGGPRAGESGGGSGGSPRCVRIFRIGTGLGVTRSAGCRRHTPGTHAETPPPPGPWAWPRLLREVSCEGQAPVPAKHEPVPSRWRVPSRPASACGWVQTPLACFKAAGDAGACAAAARDPRACRETQTARARQRRWPPAVWTFACGPGRPSWRLCAVAARTRLMRPLASPVTESRSRAKGGRAQYRSRCSKL